jgi:ubiquitin C-terminal hydrolase
MLHGEQVKGLAGVEESLRQQLQAEVLDGANKYRCDKCAKLVSHSLTHSSIPVAEAGQGWSGLCEVGVSWA